MIHLRTLPRWSVVGIGMVLAASLAFTVYPGAPRWPLVGGFHYVVDLNTTSFPAGSVWDSQAQFALADWRDIGATSFQPGIRRSAANGFVNNDGLNAWMWSDQPAQTWLGICYYRYAAGALQEADVVFNARADYPWAPGLLDPCADHANSPFDFRGVARHEAGHALGLDHDTALLSTMQPIYQPGQAIAHTGASGELPHGDDKFGCRFLYPNPSTIYNLMATCWQPVGGGVQRIPFGGSFAAGSSMSVPVYIVNQSNATFPATQKLGIYLSTNDVISTGDLRIASVQFSGSWSFHAEQLYQFPVTIPATLAPGTWHVGCIIDHENALAERYEGDNAARLGTITVTPAPRADLVVESLSISDARPERGAPVTVHAVVRNRGGAPTTVPTTTAFYVKSWTGPTEVVWSWPVMSATTPPLAPGASHAIQGVAFVPNTICAGQTTAWYLHGSADFDAVVAESDETNNWRDLGFLPQWEAGQGFAIGLMKTTLDASGVDSIGLCAKALSARAQPTDYYLLWTCSGSSPGVPLLPAGILPLNPDVCTEIGILAEGTLFHGMRGTLATGSAGSPGTIDGGTWLTPIAGGYVDVAGLFVDTATLAILGVAPTPVSFLIR